MRDKICCRCNQLIVVNNDKWVTIQDWEKAEQIAEKSMHIDCWRNMYKEKMQEQIDKITSQLKSVMPNLQGLLPNMENNGK